MGIESRPLIIAEKPSAARAIAEALGGFSTREGYMQSAHYTLSWALGHLVEQLAPEEYDPKWKRWSLESLPMVPERFGLKVVAKTGGQFRVLTKLMAAAPSLINACDAGREGELIFRYICDMAGAQQPSQRLWVSALTREGIKRAFAGLRPQAEYDRLYRSALCRSQGDWLIGMNATRAFTVKWGELLSVGRVQTPTLALLVRREREIETFVPEAYWEVFGRFATPDGREYQGKWFGPDGDRLAKGDEAKAIALRTEAQSGHVESAEAKPAVERPPQLLDLTSLQREANRRFGLTAAATLKAAQSLYEKKLITYPRTDSRYLTKDLAPGLPGVLQALGTVSEFREAAAGANPSLVHAGNRRVVDDTKVTDHHAIIPTAERAEGLAGVDAKVYGLVARRFIAQFYPEARFLDTEIITAVGALPDRFRSRGRRVLEQGWRAVEQEAPRKKGEDSEEELTALPPLRTGEAVRAQEIQVKHKETQPPRRYSEANLLSAMEFAGKEMDDDALREAMKGHGLGTPATRAAIIERLKDVGYVVVEKKALVPTPKGRELIRRAEEAGAQVLLSPELTGVWEKHIAQIQSGEYEPGQFMAGIRGLSTQVVEWVRQAKGGPPPAAAGSGRNRAKAAGKSSSRRPRAKDATAEEAGVLGAVPVSAGKCPRCGRAVVRTSRGWVCANEGCTLRVPTFLCGKVVDQSLAEVILSKGRSPLITGFTSQRTGKEFSAYLVLKDLTVVFEFQEGGPRRVSTSGRRPVEGSTGERKTAAKAGPRKAGGRTGGRTKETPAAKPAGARVGRRSPRAPEPAGGGPA